MAAPKRTTAYFTFVAAFREETKAALLASGGAAGVAAVGKALGEKWRALSDEEKQARATAALEAAGARLRRGRGAPAPRRRVCTPPCRAHSCLRLLCAAPGGDGVRADACPANAQVYVDKAAAVNDAVRAVAAAAAHAPFLAGVRASNNCGSVPRSALHA